MPNPFGASVRLYIAGPEEATARVLIIDPTGRLVRMLWRGLVDERPRGLEWDGLDEFGHDVPTGVYLVRIETESETVTRRVVKAR